MAAFVGEELDVDAGRALGFQDRSCARHGSDRQLWPSLSNTDRYQLHLRELDLPTTMRARTNPQISFEFLLTFALSLHLRLMLRLLCQ